MPCLSLRGVIAALAVVGPTIVAIVTLTLTLNASLTALRDMGREHSAALLRNANLRTGPVFQRPERMLKAMQNYTRSRVWEHPSDNSTVFERWDAVHQTVFFESEFVIGALFTYFADNTLIAYLNSDANHYSMGATYPDSLRAAQAAGLTRQAGGLSKSRQFDRATHATTATYESRISNRSFAGAGTMPWERIFLPFTFGGQASIYGPVVATSNKFLYDLRVGRYPTPSVAVIIPLIAPLYRMNDAMTASNVYGFTIYYMFVDDVDSFLATLQGTPNTRAFAVDSNGLIIASSMSRSNPHLTFRNVTGSRPASPPAPNCILTDPGLSDFGDFVVCRTYRTQYSVDTVRALPESLVHAAEPSVEFLRKLAGGKNYFAASARVATSLAGIEINLVLVFPEEDIIGDVVKSRNTSIGIAVAVVLAVALLSAAIVSWVLSPLEVIAGRMDRAADLEDDDTDRSLSPLHEIHALQEAYFAMNDELNRIRSFVPQSVLQAKQRQYEDQDADMDEGSNPRDVKMSISGDAAISTSDRRTDLSDTRSQATSHSRRSSRKSSRRYGGSSAAGEVVTTTLGCSLHSQLVSVLAFDAVGFHTAVEGVSAGAVLSHMAVVIDAVSAELRRTNGVLERFQGDHCTATYNAVRPCPAHARQAATAAWQITHTVQHIGLKLPHCAGVATGRCLVGNAGSDAVKTFAVLGSTYTQAMDLQRRCRDYGVPVLITARTYEDVSTTFEACFVDLVRRLPGSKRPALLAAITGMHSHGNDGGSKNPTAGGGDAEWLYVVGGPESQLNVAFRELAQGRPEHAQALVAEHVPAVSTKPASATSTDALGSTTAQEVQLPPGNSGFTTTAEWPVRVRDAAIERLRTLSMPGTA